MSNSKPFLDRSKVYWVIYVISLMKNCTLKVMMSTTQSTTGMSSQKKNLFYHPCTTAVCADFVSRDKDATLILRDYSSSIELGNDGKELTRAGCEQYLIDIFKKSNFDFYIENDEIFNNPESTEDQIRERIQKYFEDARKKVEEGDKERNYVGPTETIDFGEGTVLKWVS